MNSLPHPHPCPHPLLQPHPISSRTHRCLSRACFFKQTLFWAKPGKEIEITTNQLTMCLKYGRFSGLYACKLRAYKENVYMEN